MNRIKIREFRTTDLSLVQKLIYQTIDICYPEYYPPLAVQYFKDYHDESNILERSKTGKVLLVETNNYIIGTGSIVGNEISGVFIHPNYQRQGFGKAIMNKLEEIGRLNGYTETELSISLPSLDFYENKGYKILEESSIDVGDNQVLEYWKASKDLSLAFYKSSKSIAQ